MKERDQTLFELEQRLAQVSKKLSLEEASLIIADDFVEFGSSGKVWSKPEIIAAMTEWSPIDRTIEAFTVRELGPSLCLVTYRSLRSDRSSSFSLRSSIWRSDGKTWQIIFHQGTSVD